jgi:hypothetical protein
MVCASKRGDLQGHSTIGRSKRRGYYFTAAEFRVFFKFAFFCELHDYLVLCVLAFCHTGLLSMGKFAHSPLMENSKKFSVTTINASLCYLLAEEVTVDFFMKFTYFLIIRAHKIRSNL